MAPVSTQIEADTNRVIDAFQKTRKQRIMEDETVAHSIKFRFFVVLCALLPGIGCYFCMTYTYIFQFDKIVNFRHDTCTEVHSWIPPVSYPMGIWEPQRFFWIFIMFIHMPARIAFIVLYRRLFLLNAPKSVGYNRLLWCFTLSMWIEPIAMIGGSVVDLSSNFVIHAICYALWLISFNCNMIFNVLLNYYSRLRRMNKTLWKTWFIKRAMFISGVVISISGAICYSIFSAYCNQTAYYCFSVIEYYLVIHNSIYYFLTFYEFPNIRLTIGLQGLGTLSHPNVVRAEAPQSGPNKELRAVLQNPDTHL